MKFAVIIFAVLCVVSQCKSATIIQATDESSEEFCDEIIPKINPIIPPFDSFDEATDADLVAFITKASKVAQRYLELRELAKERDLTCGEKIQQNIMEKIYEKYRQAFKAFSQRVEERYSQ